ncbi:MAG TPA: hypothetical protein VKY89_00920, partial [Thermoanaerobaculia bacterium]|nr:hypothetical protein [Thermoanaerobaculia bacterium]
MAKARITAVEAARRIHRANLEIAACRKALAAAVQPGRRSPHVFAGEWRRINAALERSRALLSKIPGVVGHGLGRRFKAGRETEERCLVVFVREKKTLAELKRERTRRVPKTIRSGSGRIPIDVVQMGPLRRQDGIESIGEPGSGRWGTIGALAFDLATRQRVAITAMHVTGKADLDVSAGDTALVMASPSDGPVVGQLVLGTTSGVDAAKVLLADSVQLVPPLSLKDARPISNDHGISVRLFGAASQLQRGVVQYLNVNLLINGESLINTLLVSIATTDGDSGAGLVDESGYLLGFLVGVSPLPGQED